MARTDEITDLGAVIADDQLIDRIAAGLDTDADDVARLLGHMAREARR